MKNSLPLNNGGEPVHNSSGTPGPGTPGLGNGASAPGTPGPGNGASGRGSAAPANRHGGPVPAGSVPGHRDRPPQLVMIGFFPSFIRALDRAMPPGSLTVIEDPDIYAKKPIRALEPVFACLSEVRLAAYQQSDDHLEALRRIRQESGVTGVVPGLEYAVEAAAAGAEECGLPGLGVRAASVLRDKIRLREVTSAAGMAAPAFRELHGPEDLAAFLKEVAGSGRAVKEVVLKPANRQASLGVRFLRPGDDVASAWAATVGADEGAQIADRTMTWRYLAEERLIGPEVSVEVLVADAEILFANVTAKTTADGDNPVEVGHVMPAPLPEETLARLHKGMRALIRAADIGTGILCAEWIITEEGPVLVECAGRCPGDSLMELLGLVYGGDFFQHVAAILQGERPPVGTVPHRAAAIRFLQPQQPGRIVDIKGAAQAQAAPGVQEVTVTAKPGLEVAGLASNWDRLGHVIAVGADPAEAAARARTAVQGLRVTVEPLRQAAPAHRPSQAPATTPRRHT